MRTRRSWRRSAPASASTSPSTTSSASTSRASRRAIFGYSYFFQTPVTGLILERLAATLLLVISSQVLAIVVGTVLGVIAARRPNGATSHAVTLLALFGYSAPVFWTGIMLIILFCSIVPIFPVGGMIDVRVEGGWLVRGLDVLHHLVLPMVTLASIFLALYSRLARAAMLDVLGSDYVRTARAKGLSEFLVVYKHALRNALGPVVTLAGLQFSQIISGAVLVETVFSWPGLGSLALQSILARDTPTILGILFFSSLVVVVANPADGSRLQPGRSPHQAGGAELTMGRGRLAG